MKILKTVIYFLSIVGPLADILKGALAGVEKGLADLHADPQAGKTLSDLEDK